jgi:nucleoside-diphosphate-sugar epimerase
MEALRESNRDARVIFASTRQVYGRPQYLPVDERHPVHPTDVNGINKHAGEQYHLLYTAVYEIPTIVLRLTNTYGPRQLMHHGRQGFIPVFVRLAMENKTIRLFGGGSQRRDANYVDDVVEAFLVSGVHADRLSGRVFNLGGEPSFSLLEFVETLVDVVGAGSVETAPWPPEKARIDIGDFEADFSAFRGETGWAPRTPLREGLSRMVEFYRAHGEHYW